MIGRRCTDNELERLRRQLTQCQTKVHRLESERHSDMDMGMDSGRVDELEMLKQRLLCHTCVIMVICFELSMLSAGRYQ